MDEYAKMASDRVGGMGASAGVALATATPIMQRAVEQIQAAADTLNVNTARINSFADRVRGARPQEAPVGGSKEPEPHCLELALERALNWLHNEAQRNREATDRLDGIA